MDVQGIGIGRGVVIGPVVRMADAVGEPDDGPSAIGPAAESARAESALQHVATDLDARAESAGGTAHDILEAQALMARDPSIADDVAARLAGGLTAERAVFEAFAGFRDMLTAQGGYLAERATDLDDVSARVVATLRGSEATGVPDPGHPFVLVARDLAPADTAGLDLEQVLAIVTEEGGPTAHTAILAREKRLPAVVGASGALGIADGTEVIVDAGTGRVVIAPDAATLEDARARIAAAAARGAAPASPGALADGTPVPLLANLGSVDGIAAALAAGAEGVGLFRTEFLFLDAETAPSVAEQTEAYRAVLDAFPNRKVVVRVLDAGADKPLSFVGADSEPNPALGLRGLRALRAAEPVLHDQLAALAAAASGSAGEAWVMAPMVAGVEDARWFTEYAHRVGLRSAGIMVEVPSAAILADRVLPVTDFASIGTNDLTQYALAADRQLGGIAALQDPWHPAVLALIASVGAAGRATGTPVGVCGEAAADPLLAVVLVGLGVTSLSMAPSAIADVRAGLAEFDAGQAGRLAEVATAADGPAEAREAVRAEIERMRGR